MQKRPVIYLLLLVALAAILGLMGCGSRQGTLRGQVTNKQTGEAVAQVRVAVYGLTDIGGSGQPAVYQKGAVLQEQVTDEKGGYAFSLGPGNYVVQAWVNDQKVGDRMVNVKSGRATDVDFEVELPSP